MSKHRFLGSLISNEIFANKKPKDILDVKERNKINATDTTCNSHILFRKKFTYDEDIHRATIYITADDYYKLYINGHFVGQGPTTSYIHQYGYNRLNIRKYLKKGENVMAIHTYYQGLINRVWISGDDRHGLLCDLEIDGKIIVKSDSSFLTHPHTAYQSNGIIAYSTQFLENYDSNAKEVDFYQPDFDDSSWQYAKKVVHDDHQYVLQSTKMLSFEAIKPISIQTLPNKLLIDFGKIYVGYLKMQVQGNQGQVINIRCGQELASPTEVRYQMRCFCNYDEKWTLSGKIDTLNQFDYKSFRYVEICHEQPLNMHDIHLSARHYPFKLKTNLHPEYQSDQALQAIWQLAVNSQHYGVQEVVLDCMDREKGFYLGDGCYSALTQMILTKDDHLARKLIDDAFESKFIEDTLVTCLDCGLVQQIAEFPLILIDFILWHYRLMGDIHYLKKNYKKIMSLLDNYRRDYETDGILNNLDKWCVVEWPDNFRDHYDVDITEGKVCTEAHVSINAYYLHAIETTNKIAAILKEKPYRQIAPLHQAFTNTFYSSKDHCYYDNARHSHISFIGNIFPFAFGLYEDQDFETKMIQWIKERGIKSTSLFCTFLLLEGLIKTNQRELIASLIKDPGAYLNMLQEGATTTFEAWGKEQKFNTSLFHLTYSYIAIFLADIDIKSLFE